MLFATANILILSFRVVCDAYELQDTSFQHVHNDEPLEMVAYCLEFPRRALSIGPARQVYVSQQYVLTFKHEGKDVLELRFAQPGIAVELVNASFAILRDFLDDRVFGISFISERDANEFMLTAAAAYQQQEEHISLSSAADPRVSASPRPTRPQRNSIKTLSNTSTPVAGLPHAGSQAATRTISAPATSSPLHDNKGVSSSSSTRAAPPRPPRQSMRQHSRSFSDADGRAAHVAAGRTTELAGPKHGGHETAHRRSSSYDSHNIAGQIEDMRLEGKRELGPNGTQMETQARGEMANNTLFLKGTFKIKLELVADLKLQKLVAPQRAKRRDVTASMHGAYLELAAADGSPEEKLDLHDALCAPHVSSKHKHCLTLALPSSCVYSLIFEEHQAMLRWLHHIHAAAAAAQAQSSDVFLMKVRVANLFSDVEDELSQRESFRSRVQMEQLSSFQHNHQHILDLERASHDIDILATEHYRLETYLAALTAVFGDTASFSAVSPVRMQGLLSDKAKRQSSLLGAVLPTVVFAYICLRSSRLRRSSAVPEASKSDPREAGPQSSIPVNALSVVVPDGSRTVVKREGLSTAADLLETVCRKRSIDPHAHLLQAEPAAGRRLLLPLESKLQATVQHYHLLPKAVREVALSRPQGVAFGLRIGSGQELQASSTSNRNNRSHNIVHNSSSSMGSTDESRLYIIYVEVNSLADLKGFEVGDELLQVDGRDVTSSDVSTVLTTLSRKLHASLRVRSSRRTDSEIVSGTSVDDIIDDFVNPPPLPAAADTHDVELMDMVVPPPPFFADDLPTSPNKLLESSMHSAHGFDFLEQEGAENYGLSFVNSVSQFVKTTDEVSKFLRKLLSVDQREAQPGSTQSSVGEVLSPPDTPQSGIQHLEAAAHKMRKKRRREREKLWSTIEELLTTERSYVQALHLVHERYVSPLLQDGILDSSDKALVLGNLSALTSFQEGFLKEMERCCVSMPAQCDLREEASPACKQLFEIAVQLARLFQAHMESFKVYAQYCSGHAKAVEIITDKSRTELQALLDARNPRQEQSATFSSYLIRPVQRVLKYPLLLREMASHLGEHGAAQRLATNAMNDLARLATHINSMTKICDLFEAETSAHLPSFVLSQNFHQLVHHSAAIWCNCLERRKKKSIPVYLLIFRTRILLFELEQADKQKRKASIFTLPKYKFLRNFDLDNVVGAANFSSKRAGVPEDLLPLCWGFYHSSTSEAEEAYRKSTERPKEAPVVPLPLSAKRELGHEESRLYVFQAEHDAAKSECLRQLHEALLSTNEDQERVELYACVGADTVV